MPPATTSRALKSGAASLPDVAIVAPDLPIIEAIGLRAIGLMPRGMRAGAGGVALELAGRLGLSWADLLGEPGERLNLVETSLSAHLAELGLLRDQVVQVDGVSAPALS
jgi:hypothetical protein